MGENHQSPKVIDISQRLQRKPAGVEMLSVCKDRVFTAWLRGSPERNLARAYERPRPVIEAVIREAAQERIWHPPAQGRRAA